MKYSKYWQIIKMADEIGQQDIYGLDIDRLAKGFGEFQYNFMSECTVVKFKGDSKRWFQKTAGTLTATAPSYIETSARARPEELRQSWTRNTSYVRTFMLESTMAEADIADAEIDVWLTTIRDLTEAVVKARDAHIWDVMSESQSPSNIQTFATTAQGGDQWDAANYAADPIVDILHAKKLMDDQGYDSEGSSLLLNTAGHKSLVSWLISGKGSSIPGYASQKITKGTVSQLLGVNIKKNLNVTTDYAMLIKPKRATTYAENLPLSSGIDRQALLSRTVRVVARGVAYNTDPKAIVLISDINT